MKQTINLHAHIAIEYAGQRLDAVLAMLFPEHSRSRLQSWLKAQHILVNGRHWQGKEKVSGGEEVVIHAEIEQYDNHAAESIPLSIIFEDEYILVINKPVGLVVHPAVGNQSGTLLNALLHHHPDLVNLPRAGIIHRLDKDTSGIMVVAKTLEAHTELVRTLQDREIHREYHAIVCGVMTAGGKIEAPIDRHPTQRTKMAVVANGKDAVTHYRVLQRYRAHTYIRVMLETGRTHQIRVHMSHIQYPILGDMVYNHRIIFPKGASDTTKEAIRQFRRQALHAVRLELEHPITNEPVVFEAPVPEDMKAMLAVLATDLKEKSS